MCQMKPEYAEARRMMKQENTQVRCVRMSGGYYEVE